MTQHLFNHRLRQILILALIILMGVLLISQLTEFIPGLLGGFTLYILSRSLYFRLIFKKKWKKGWTAMLFILAYIVLISLPVYFSITLITPKISSLLNNQDKIVEVVQKISGFVETKTGFKILSGDTAKQLAQKATALVPKLLNSTASILTNLIMMFFLLYYLLVEGRSVEKRLGQLIPLEKHNVDALGSETRMMVKANALGIPIISIIQGLTASIGYWIFGIEDWGMWGFVTGVFAFFPLVGTMIIWVPLMGYLFAQGHNWQAVGLLIYSIVVTGNVDYLARLSLMKRMGDVHPMVTVLGVIAGLSLFGFIGLIFGPLLVSYFLVLLKIYLNEFGNPDLPDEIKEVEQNKKDKELNELAKKLEG